MKMPLYNLLHRQFSQCTYIHTYIHNIRKNSTNRHTNSTNIQPNKYSNYIKIHKLPDTKLPDVVAHDSFNGSNAGSCHE